MDLAITQQAQHVTADMPVTAAAKATVAQLSCIIYRVTQLSRQNLAGTRPQWLEIMTDIINMSNASPERRQQALAAATASVGAAHNAHELVMMFRELMQ